MATSLPLLCLVVMVMVVMVDLVVPTSQYLTYPGDIMLGGLGQSVIKYHHFTFQCYHHYIWQCPYTSRGRVG